MPNFTAPKAKSVAKDLASVIESIPRIDFQAYSRKRPTSPVIVSRAAQDWPAVLDWTPGNLAKRYPNIAVRCKMKLPHGIDGGLPYLLNASEHTTLRKFERFVAELGSRNVHNPCYMNQTKVDLFPGLRKEVDFESIYPSSVTTENNSVTNIWIGSEGTRSGFHYDMLDNLYVQIFGSKYVIVAAPDQAPNLYPFADTPSKSRIDPERPDFSRYPRFKNTRLLQSVLEPGDFLYLPRLWWHYFRSLQTAISVNHWYGGYASTDEMKVIINSLGTGFKIHRIISHNFDFLKALLGYSARRLFAPPSTGSIAGNAARAKLESILRSWSRTFLG